MDELTMQFLDVVDCELVEVKDIPLERRQIDQQEECAISMRAHQERKMKKKANKHNRQLQFGKHRGKFFCAVPVSYLEWLVEQPVVPNALVEQTKAAARKYLAANRPPKLPQKNRVLFIH